MNDLVTCTLAHPLGAEGARSVGLPHRDHEVGEEVTLVRGHAMRLVASGLVAGADPKDPEAVKAALRPATPKPAPAAPAPASTPAPAPAEAPAKPAGRAAKPPLTGDPA